MPHIPIPVLFPIPTDEDDFEDLCVDILRIYWSRPKLERYGRKGERQNGIDILDVGGVTPLHAAQCKLKEFQKTLSASAIEAEVTDACRFEFPIGKYGILTTAKISTEAQKKILEINQRHLKAGLFEVELLTWGKLCRLIQKYDEVRSAYFEHTAITLSSRIGSKSAIVAQHIQEAGITFEIVELSAEIDLARESLQKKEFQNALLILNRALQRSDLPNATPHERFRISSNLGAAEFGLGRFEKAAEHFIESFVWAPDDEGAQTNEVFAHIVRGDLELAHQKATLLRKKYPESAKIATNWIVSAPKSMTLVEIENNLSSSILADGQINLALSRCALREMNVAKGVCYAKAAVSVLPDSAETHLALAHAYMGWIVSESKGVGTSEISRKDLEGTIETSLSHALDLSTKEGNTYTQAETLVIRADLRIAQERLEEAETDAYEALRIEPESVQALLALSHVHGIAQRMEKAVGLLERAYRKSGRPEAALIYARGLVQRARPEDLQLAASILGSIDISGLRGSFGPAAVSTVIDAFVRLKDTRSARDYLEGAESHLTSSEFHSLLAHIATMEGNREEAQQLALQAQSELDDSAIFESKEFLGRILVRLELFSEALPLLQQLFSLRTQAFDSAVLLNCAAQLHRDDIVIATCEELERRGQDLWSIVSFEVQHLQKYSREKAVNRLDNFIRSHPGHKLAMLMRSALGVQSNQPALVSGTIEDLPSIEELPAACIITAVHVLRFSSAGNATVDFAYRFLREHFSDLRAHQALILSLLPGDPSINLPVTMHTAAEGAAIAVREDLSGTIRWFVLERTETPNTAFEELSSSSELAKELTGKRVGDNVIIAKGHLESRTGKVIQILSKYVRRYQDCMNEMQVRFGSASSIESIHIGTTEEEIRNGLEKIVESAKSRELAIRQVRRIYDENSIPTHLFGEKFGKNAYTAIAYLAQEDSQSVKCCAGTSDERRASIFALQTCSNVVVSITVIATLRMIGCEDLLLEPGRFNFQMSEGTFDELQETLLGDFLSGATSGTILHRDGVSSFIEETADQKLERHALDQKFLEQLRSSIEIVPVMELSALEPTKRDLLESVCGGYGAETILLASRPGAVLWTDDLIEAEIAKLEFRVERVWTEIVAERAVLSGQLEEDERQRIVASLVGLNYTATYFDSITMLKSLELANGIVWHFPFRQFVSVFSAARDNLQGLIGIFVDFIQRLYRENYLPESRAKVVVALLDALWGHVVLRIPLQLIRKNCSRLFPLNPVGQQQFENCFDEWYVDIDKLVGGLILPFSQKSAEFL